MKILFGNDKKPIDIQGNCKITDYDPRTEEANKTNTTIDVNDENATYQGSSVFDKKGEQKLNVKFQSDENNIKTSIFNKIASMDGHSDTLTQEDLEKAKSDYSLNKENWFGAFIGFDKDAGVISAKLGGKTILRIDFETDKEKNATQRSSNMNTNTNTKNKSGSNSVNNIVFYQIPNNYSNYWTLVQTLLPKEDENGKRLDDNTCVKYFNATLKEIAHKNGLKLRDKADKNGYYAIVNDYRNNLIIPNSVTTDNKTIKLSIPNTFTKKTVSSNDDIIREMCKIVNKESLDNFTASDTTTLKNNIKRLAEMGVTNIKVDKYTGDVSVNLVDGTAVTYSFDPDAEKLKKYMPYIKNLSKETGYSKELIMGIVEMEKFTETPTYKNENGGLWEWGFGHTSKNKPNIQKCTITQAFDLLKKDIKEKEGRIIEDSGDYYQYDKLPQSLKDALIDTAYNRGENYLNVNSPCFDSNYEKVHDYILKGDYAMAAVNLRQQKIRNNSNKAGILKRNVKRLLIAIRDLDPKDQLRAMNEFEKTGYLRDAISTQASKAEGRYIQSLWDKYRKNISN